MATTHTDKIVDYLESKGVSFRRIEHPPAATALEYNQVLGCRLTQQVKVLLLKVKRYGRVEFIPYALPGGKKADLKSLERLLEADKISLCSKEELFAETGCRFGELHPIAAIYERKLIFDNELMLENEVLFNAGVLDQSIAIAPNFLRDFLTDIVVGTSSVDQDKAANS